MKKTFDDFAKEINIAEVLDSFGYTLNKDKSAKNIEYGWLVFDKKNNLGHSDETLLVKRNNNSTSKYQGQYFFMNANDKRDSGNVIHFLCSRKGWHMKDNAKELNDYLNTFQGNYVARERVSVKPLKAVSEEERNKAVLRYYQTSPLSDYTYLSARGVSKETCSNDLFKGKVLHNEVVHTDDKGKEYSFKNTVFPMTTEEGQVVGMEVKNNNFHGNAPESDKASSLWVSNIDKSRPIDAIIIAESGIDCLSHYQLYQDSLYDRNVVYVSTGGNLADGQVLQIEKLCLHLDPQSLVLANDNDLAGIRFNINISGKTNIIGDKDVSYQINKEGSYNYKATIKVPESSLNTVFTKLVNSFVDEVGVSISKSNGVEISIPNNSVVMCKLEKNLLEIKQVENLVKIHRPVLKDFNDDLKQKLGIVTEVKKMPEAKKDNNLKR